MFFLMRYQTVVATRREINLARQFCRVSLATGWNQCSAPPFQIIRLPPAFISRWSFLSPRVPALQGNEILMGQVESSPYALRSGRYGQVFPMG